MNVNKAILVGRVARDPEVKSTPSGQTVCSFSLATNKEWKGKDGEKQSKTEWHNLVFWGKLAEIVGQYVTKGQELYVEGRIEYREWEDKEGVKRKNTDIIVEQMQMGSKANAQGTTRSAQPTAPEPAEQIPTIDLDDDNEVRIEDVPF